MSNVKEESAFLKAGGEPLFAVFCSPDATTERGVVLCHPLGEEKLWAHRPFVHFSRELASHGFAVVRFDCRGEGDSGLAFEETTLDTRLEDTRVALDELRQRHPTITNLSLVGLRFGANVAAAVAATRHDVRRLVLWDPVMQGENYAHSLLRINLAGQLAAYRKVVEGRDELIKRMRRGETVNVEGYALTQVFFQQICCFSLVNTLRSFRGKALLLAAGSHKDGLSLELREMSAALPEVEVRATSEQPFWKETKTFFQCSRNFAPATLSWLEVTA